MAVAPQDSSLLGLVSVMAPAIVSGNAAIVIASGSEEDMVLPGFQSVATATGSPIPIIRRAGAYGRPSVKAVPGRRTPTTPAAAMALSPSSEE